MAVDEKKALLAIRLQRVGQLERTLPIAIHGHLNMKSDAIGYDAVGRKIEELKHEYKELTGRPYSVRKV